MVEAVAGVWQRVSLEAPTGETIDVSSSVWWVQSHAGLFVDVRIPYRNSSPQESKLDEILRQRASAGMLDCQPHSSATAELPAPVLRCTWSCDLDYHPPSGEADIGLAAFVDDLVMIETGVHSDYREVWVRRDEGHEQMAMELIEEQTSSDSAQHSYKSRARRGIWVVSGRYFAQVLDRHASVAGTLGHRIATTQSSSLKELLAETWQIPEADQSAVATLFLCCFGVIEKGIWRVKKSTDPALEDTVFFEVGGSKGRLLALLTEGNTGTRVQETLPDGTRRLWRICMNTFRLNPLEVVPNAASN
jgi:hypothetical protein